MRLVEINAKKDSEFTDFYSDLKTISYLKKVIEPLHKKIRTFFDKKEIKFRILNFNYRFSSMESERYKDSGVVYFEIGFLHNKKNIGMFTERKDSVNEFTEIFYEFKKYLGIDDYPATKNFMGFQVSICATNFNKKTESYEFPSNILVRISVPTLLVNSSLSWDLKDIEKQFEKNYYNN